MRFPRLRLCWVLTAGITVACSPRYSPEKPGAAPEDTTLGQVTAGPAATPRTSPAREVLIGELCPNAAAGRPAVKPLFIRRVTWSAAAADVTRPVETRSARQFSVFGWAGHRAGVFSVAGASPAGTDGTVAVGAYAGSSPCQAPAAGGGSAAVVDEACVGVTAHCGLAVAVVEASSGPQARPFAEDPERVDFDTGGACAGAGKLRVDIDGDGRAEQFRLRDFIDPMRAPTDDVSAISGKDKACTPSFSIAGAVPAADPRDWRGLDVLGVLDVDGDGRRELILAYRYAGRSTWAIYSASGTPARLELVGEVCRGRVSRASDS